MWIPEIEYYQKMSSDALIYDHVNNLGETFSPTARAVLIHRQAELSETDHMIITVNLNLDLKSEKAL